MIIDGIDWTKVKCSTCDNMATSGGIYNVETKEIREAWCGECSEKFHEDKK